MKRKLDRFRYIIFDIEKIGFESQNFPIFDNFYSTDHKTVKLFNGLVVGFGPKGRPGRMWNSVR